MNIILLNLTSYFIFNLLLKSTKQYIILNNIFKYNLNYKYTALYIKNSIKKIFFNLQNKINSTKSTNKKSKTYYASSHIAKKGLFWAGIRQLYLKYYNSIYNKILLLSIFNLRSNLNIYNLELIKLLYYINILNKKIIKLILNNNKFNYNNFIIYNYNLLFKLNTNNINLIY